MSDENGAAVTKQEAPPAPYSRTAEAADLLTASIDSLTPALVQRMVTTMAQMAEMIDIINTDEMKKLLATASEVADSLECSLRTLKEMADGGAISGLAQMGVFADALRNSMTSGIAIRSLSSVLSLAEVGDQMLEAVRDSADEAKKDTRKIGPVTLLNALKDPQTQESLKFILALSKKMPALLENI